MRPSRLIALLSICLLLLHGPAGAWGAQGHRLIAALAWAELTPQAREGIAVLLAGEPDPTLQGIATWADRLRGDDRDLGRRSARWHYVNIAAHGCEYEAASACRGGDCVVEAIRAQAAILADRTRPLDARRQALKFVVHFVGDVHQPLHAGYRHDKGGNTVQISVDGDGSNLHRLWDSGLFATAGLDDDAYLRSLRKLPLDADSGSGPADWAEASCRVVVQPGFYPERTRIDDAYMERWRPVADARLRQAGSHLAQVLNQALAAPRRTR